MDNQAGQIGIRRWFWIASIWLGIGLFDATQTVVSMRAEGMHHAWTRLFWTLFLSWLPLALSTPWVLRLGRRYPPARLRPLSAWLIHFSVASAICFVTAAWTAGMEKVLNPWAYSHDPGRFLTLLSHKFWNGLFSFLLLYASMLAISYALDYRERLARQQAETARLNEQLSKAQLSALRSQIEPHFLFNTLNAIAGLVRDGRNDDAVGMIATLGDLLRRMVEEPGRHEVTLGEELAFTQKYLDIQKMRLAERLTVAVNVPLELHTARVPSLILQPLVENAIQHGIAELSRGGALRVGACRSNGRLNLSVENDGPVLSRASEPERAGIGLSNTTSRLRSLYGNNFSFTIKEQDLGGVQVSISLPFREK
jgi:two-component system, LytTR family, sensor kinase